MVLHQVQLVIFFKILRKNDLEVAVLSEILRAKHVFSHLEWHMRGWQAERSEKAPDLQWGTPAEINIHSTLPPPSRPSKTYCKQHPAKLFGRPKSAFRFENITGTFFAFATVLNRLYGAVLEAGHAMHAVTMPDRLLIFEGNIV